MSQASSRGLVFEDRRQSRGLCPFSAAKLIHPASKDRSGRTKVSRRDTPSLNRAAKCPVPGRSYLADRPGYALRKPPS
jgi:hypothetical protein